MSSSRQALFSIVLPTHNRRELLERSIASVRAQAFDDWELLVIDDGSDDGTAEFVAALGDPRIRLFCQASAGVSAARNRGIEQSRGRYIAFLDDDDEYLPTHLLVLKGELQSRGYPECLAYTLAYRSEEGALTPIVTPSGDDRSPIVLGSNPETPNVSVHRSLLVHYRFDVNLKRHEDAELWGRIARSAPVVRIDQRTTVIHTHSGDRLTKASLETLVELESTYRHIRATRDSRVHVPKAALMRKERSINLGLAREYISSSRRTRGVRYLLRQFRLDPRVLVDERFWSVVRMLGFRQ